MNLGGNGMSTSKYICAMSNALNYRMISRNYFPPKEFKFPSTFLLESLWEYKKSSLDEYFVYLQTQDFVWCLVSLLFVSSDRMSKFDTFVRLEWSKYHNSNKEIKDYKNISYHIDKNK